MTPEEKKYLSASIIAILLDSIIDEDNKVAESDEDEMWKLGFHESVNFMLQELQKIRKQYI
jgi:hypothetical protein